jgi:hypothetical protein
MASLFDPSAFIEAENSQLSQTLASVCEWSEGPSTGQKTAEIHHFRAEPEPALARIATIAGIHPEMLPWSDDLENWASNPCPDFIAPNVWDEITHEALTVSRTWGRIALDAGWSALDLFGCHTRPQYRRRDRNGLVQTIVNLLTPVRIIGLSGVCAELVDRNGTVMRFKPRHRLGSVHLWEAYAMPNGP